MLASMLKTSPFHRAAEVDKIVGSAPSSDASCDAGPKEAACSHDVGPMESRPSRDAGDTDKTPRPSAPFHRTVDVVKIVGSAQRPMESCPSRDAGDMGTTP